MPLLGGQRAPGALMVELVWPSVREDSAAISDTLSALDQVRRSLPRTTQLFWHHTAWESQDQGLCLPRFPGSAVPRLRCQAEPVQQCPCMVAAMTTAKHAVTRCTP